MLIIRATAHFALCLSGMCIAASAFAINPPSLAKQKLERREQAAKIDKAKRRDKDIQHRIQTYNLFHDPVFKLKGAMPDRRLPGATSPSLPPKTFSAAPASPLLKMQAPETSGIAFGCRDKAQSPRPATGVRELTACYKHSVDRAWKAQTYVSREVADGNQRWGGGLALHYAY